MPLSLYDTIDEDESNDSENCLIEVKGEITDIVSTIRSTICFFYVLIFFKDKKVPKFR